MSDPSPHIIVDDVSLVFPTSGLDLKSALLGKRSSRSKLTALRNVSVTLKAGDRLALVGLNGAGKTTLLRVMAEILPPTSGGVYVHGSVGTLLGDGVGFELEQSGSSNTYSRLLSYGLSTRQAKVARDDVEEFVDLGPRFLEPVKHYSTGMTMRVAFATATAIRPSILLMDEVLGAGDISFMGRAQDRLERMIETASILVLASHSPDVLRRYCRLGIWLEAGQIVMGGDLDEVLLAYESANGRTA